MQTKPDTTEEEIGIESYHIKRRHAVERALEKIRRSLPAAWQQLSPHDLELLNFVLGEVWANSERGAWDDVVFSGMRVSVLVKLISLGDQVMNLEKENAAAWDEAGRLLAGLR
jgi:hypothetical protein